VANPPTILTNDGSEVILVQITGGGHNWPGRLILPGIDNLLGPITHDISANDMIWEFFQKHPMKQAGDRG